LKEELAKKNPVEAFVNAYRKAACEADSIEGFDECQTSGTEGQGFVAMEQKDEKVEGESEMEIPDEPETVISDDVEMSNADSGDKGSAYGSSINSSEGSESEESAASTRSRKRPADESPEREPPETTRKEFPGTMTRRGGGCRVHLPVALGTAGTMESTSATSDTMDTTVPINIASDIAVAPGTRDILSETDATALVDACDAASTTAVSETAANTGTMEAVEMLSGNKSVNLIAAAGMARPVAQSTAPAMIAATATDIALREVVYQRATTGEPILVPQPVTTFRNPVPLEDVVASGSATVTPTVSTDVQANLIRPYVAHGWMRDAHMVEAIFQIIEGMEPPWITLNVLEVAVERLPHVDPEV